MEWSVDYNIEELQGLVEVGTLTYLELTQHYLDQIKAYNGNYNAVSEINDQAIEIASALDEEFKTSGRRSLLHGIPILIKDNINIADSNMHTTAGSVALKDQIASYDATIVKKLKESGAVILGKTNLSEFANFISEKSPNGYSALKGQVVNPYGEFDVGGSSSGSGVAVATGMCQVAIGTETSGSIISPASRNSIIGLKPSVGVVSRDGIIPISSTQDVPGPMSRHLLDICIVQSIIEGYDPLDYTTDVFYNLSTTKESQKRNLFDFQEKVKIKDLRLGIYVEREDAFERRDANKVFSEAVEKLEQRGVSRFELTFNPLDYKINWDVLYYEFPKALANYLEKASVTCNGMELKTLSDIVECHEKDIKTFVPYDQEQFQAALKLEGAYDSDYSRALRDSSQYGRLMEQWIMTHELDGVCYVDCDGVDIAARNGLPSITFPIGYTDEGSPVGFTITTSKYHEEKLLKLAYNLMPIIGKHRKPEGL